jgi:hypothetical protein
MTVRGTAGLMALLAAFCGYLWLSARPAVSPAPPGSPLLAIPADRVTRIQIEWPDARLAAVRNAGAWRGAAGGSVVPTRQIDDLLATLATIRPVTTLAPAEREAAAYGFGDAATAVRLDAGGEVALELEVGDRNPAWTGVYVRRAGSPEAHLVGALLRWDLDKLHDAMAP